MVHDQPTRDGEKNTEAEKTEAEGREGAAKGPVNRRSYLKLASATAASLGLSAGASAVSAAEASKPSDGPNGISGDVPDANWQLTFHDNFDQGELDTDKWGIGFPWGRTHIGDETVRDQDVWVDSTNDHLVMQYGYDDRDGWYSGAVNTSESGSSTSPNVGHEQFQGFFEASIRMNSHTDGTLPAFWLNCPAWPPELDILERFGGGWSDRATMTVHWGESPGSSTGNSNIQHVMGDPAGADAFHTYGAYWHDDGTDYYVDGNYVGTVTEGHSNDSSLREMNNGDPMEMLFSNHLTENSRGGLDRNDPAWPRTWEVDWVRVWEAGEPTDEEPTDEEPTDEEPKPIEHTILFDGIGTSSGTQYEFTTTGPVEKSNYGGASINDDDSIDGSQVTGSVGGWRDAYEFGGELETLTIDGTARVIVDGEEIDPADYGNERNQTLTLVGNGNRTTYEVTVSGTIEIDEVTAGDVNLDSSDSASGTIERGVHRLNFSGELDEFTFTEGGTQAYLGSSRIDPDV